MNLGNYSVGIPEGVEHANGYVELRHGQTYSIRLSNNDSRRCDTLLSIDGLPMGVFRLRAGFAGIIERPVEDAGKFTFFARQILLDSPVSLLLNHDLWILVSV